MAQMMRVQMNARVSCVAMRVPARAPRSVLARAGLFDFFAPKSAPSPRGAELVELLSNVASSTGAGSRASGEKREQIEQLVGELRQFSIKSPAKSKLLFGGYEVLYASAPTAPGGPLAGPTGPITLGDKLPVEVLEEDGSYSSSVEFKTLGFLTGSLKQRGQIRALGPDSYLLELTESAYSSGLGGAAVKELSDSFKVELLYLGEELRVVEVTGEDEDEGFLMVLKRIQEEEDEEEDEEEAAAAPKASGSKAIKAQDPGFATITERQVRRQMAKDREEQRPGSRSIQAGSRSIQAGTGQVKAGTSPVKAGTSPVKAGTSPVKVPSGPSPAAKQAEAKAQALKAKEAEQKEKAAAAARERAEAEKRAAAERQTSIRDLLSSLTDALKGKQADTKEAVQTLKEVERANAASLKKVAAVRSKVEEAEEESAEAEAALEKAAAARNEAEAQFKVAQAQLAQAQQKLKEALGAGKPKF